MADQRDREDPDIVEVDADDLFRLGLRIESLLKSIRARLGVLTFLAVVPICVSFGVGLGIGLADSGTEDSTAVIVGAGVSVVLIWLAAVLLLLPSSKD